MIFGVCGAHRTGKSTLCKAIAEDLGIEYVSSSFGEAAKRHGVDAVADLSLQDRMAIQIKVLNDHQNWLLSNTKPVITDRTPIDMLAYALAEFGMHSHREVDDPGLLDVAAAYEELTLEMTSKLYDTVFIIGPLDHYAVEPGKPPLNRAFQKHIQLLIDGAACNLDKQVQLAWVNVTDLDERKEALHKIIVERLDLLDALKKSSPHIH